MPKLRIREIRVRNFGSFTNESLNLGNLKYPVLVLGDNGAGKTVFFVDSITYAFFGVAYERGNVSKKDVSRMHRGGEVDATVILESSDGIVLEVRNKKVYRDRPRTEYPHVSILTGHNFKTLLATYIVRQGRVANFLEISAADRRKYLLEVLEYRFDRVRDKVKDEIEKIKDEINGVKNRLSEIEGMFKSLGLREVSEKVLNLALEDEKTKKRELEDKVNRLRDRLNNMRKEIERLRVKRRELEDLLKMIKDYKEALKRLDDVKRKLSNYHSKPDKIDDDILDQLKSYVDKAVEIFEKISSLSDYKHDVERLLGNYKEVSKKGDVRNISNLRNRLKSLRESKGQLKSEIRMYRERIDKLSKAGSTCPICGSELDEEHRIKILREAEDNIKSLESKIVKVNNEIRRTEKEIKNLEMLEKEVRETMGKIVRVLEEISEKLGVELPSIDDKNVADVSENFIAILAHKLTSLDEEVENILNSINDMGFKISFLRPKLKEKDISRIKEIFSSYVKEVENLYREFSRRLERIKSYDEVVKDLDEEDVNNEIGKIDADIKTLEKEYKSVENEHVEASKALGEVEARIKSLEGLRGYLESYREYSLRLENLEVEYEIHSDLYDVFKDGGFPTYLVNEIVIPRLNEYTNYYLEEFNTNFRVKFEVKGTTIDVKVYEGDRERYLNSLSGGEMTLIGLAFRLAFGRLIALLGMNYVFDFIILDEALTHLDDRNKRIVAEKLAKMVDEGVISQVIIITHDRTIQELPFMGGTVIRVDKPAAVSRVVMVDKEDIEV